MSGLPVHQNHNSLNEFHEDERLLGFLRLDVIKPTQNSGFPFALWGASVHLPAPPGVSSP